MKSWRITAVAMLILPCALLLTSCWSRVELNELAITSATSIDREGEDWVLTYQVLIPSSISTGIGIMGGANTSPVIVYSTKGRTIREAVLHSVY
ncbi:Ger(x)C family spore germination protein, partial [Paenibacillus sp. MCAF20]